MITHATRAAIVLVAVLVATCGALVLWNARRAAAEPTVLPRAELARRWLPQLRSSLARWLAVAVIVASVAAGYWALRHSIHVFVVRDGRHGPRVQLRLASELDPELVSGAVQHTWPELPSVWVVNHSSHDVRVEHEVITSESESPLVMLPPGSVGEFERIDRIGPHADLSHGHDNWLTW
jgi:hypothetical protein